MLRATQGAAAHRLAASMLRADGRPSRLRDHDVSRGMTRRGTPPQQETVTETALSDKQKSCRFNGKGIRSSHEAPHHI